MADDGNREAPPAPPAENWGRRTSIRAGAVSGPWRSGPRDDRPEAAGRPAPPPSSPSPLAWRQLGSTARYGAPAYEEPRREEPVRLEPTPPERRRRRRSLLPAIAVGALLAGTIVAAAIAFRPDPQDAPLDVAVRESRADPAPEPEVEPAAPAAPAEADRRPAAAARADGSLRLRVGPDLPAAREAAIVAELREGAPGGVLVERTPFSIGVSRVGYYHEADRTAAAALAERMSPVVEDPGGPLVVRDYGALLPEAEPGRLDLWIADSAGGG